MTILSPNIIIKKVGKMTKVATMLISINIGMIAININKVLNVTL